MTESGIDTVLCTPTAGPPAWLMSQYPDILPVDEWGRRIQFGNRYHYCVNSPEFHTAVRNIVGAMAARFGTNPNVIGWQIDNEFNRYCYCSRCRRLFQEFLSERFISIELLNQHWSTAYWSQTYDDWEQIPLPIGPHNPGLMLEFKHFITQSYKRFQKLQVEIIRPHLPAGVWITHNFMDWHDGYDHYVMNEDLDIASWDWYVGMGNHDYQSSGAAHDLVRGYKRQNFWLMETQPGNVNWKPLNNSLNKGEARTMAWHAVGHGADAVLYWQWRSPLNGQEQYHGTLLDTTGLPRLFYTEAQQIAREFSTVSDLIAGTKIDADIGFLNCFDSRWSIQWQPHHKDFDYIQHFLNYYRPVTAQNIPVDIISADEPLSHYKLVIAPTLLILTEKRIENLKAFVEAGGHLVITIRSGMKDEYNALLPARQPGDLAALSGVEVEEYFALYNPVPVHGNGWNGSSRIWAERLSIKDSKKTKVLASFGECNGWLDGQPAITTHPYGKGRVIYIGAYLDEECQRSFLQQIILEAGIKPVLETPDGVAVCKRVNGEGKEIYILINHNRKEQIIHLPWNVQKYLPDQNIHNELTMEPYGISVFTRII